MPCCGSSPSGSRRGHGSTRTRNAWLLGSDGRQKLFYYGIPEAQQWMADHVLKLMKDEGIDIYRQDFNFPPLDYWRSNDAPDRKALPKFGTASDTWPIGMISAAATRTC